MEVYQLFHENSSNYRSQIQYAPGKSYDKKSPGKRYMLSSTVESTKEIIPSAEGTLFSTRSYGEHVHKDELFLLMHNSYLVQERDGSKHSTTPSAGGLFPIELYVIVQNVTDVKPGIYHYQKENGVLYYVGKPLPIYDFLPPINSFVEHAGFLLVMTAELKNIVNKYGPRGYRYALIEAGHIGQNISLQCRTLDLGCCAIGAFYDDVINKHLQLESSEISLYMYSVGRSI